MTGFNLATYTYTNRRISLLLHIVLTAAIVLFSYYNYRSYRLQSETLADSGADISRLKNEIALLKKEALQKTGGKELITVSKKIEALKKSVEGINAILERKGFSWSELFYSLEMAAPGDVSITGIKPSYENKRVRISGQAKSLSQVTTLVDNLQNTAFIKKTVLLKESVLLIDNKHPVISFEIESDGDF